MSCGWRVQCDCLTASRWVPTLRQTSPMNDDDAYSAALSELDSIANAAMTQSEREMRAVSTVREVSVPDVCAALGREDLPWNVKKASAAGVTVVEWQKALEVAGLERCDSLGELLRVIHRAASAAAMIRAGYRAERGEGGALRWTR